MLKDFFHSFLDAWGREFSMETSCLTDKFRVTAYFLSHT